MRKYKEFTIQSADGTVIWTTSLLVTETELKPERSAGEYWRGTYEVKRGDTLSDVAKRYGTRVSTLLELNPSIKDKDEISVGAILRVPPNKQSNDRNSERKNPPKPKQPVDETHGSTQSASPSVNSSQSDQIASNSSASSVQSRAAAPSASQGVSPHTNAQPRQVQQQKTTPNADSQTINKIESSNQDGNSVTTLTPECVCKKYDLIWGAKVSCAFRKKVVEISKRINCDPNDLMAVMAAETADTFWSYIIAGKNAKTNPKQSEITEAIIGQKGIGLVQWTPIAIQDMNGRGAQFSAGRITASNHLTALKLAKMTSVEQLDYVEMYLKMQMLGKNSLRGAKLSLSQLYALVFVPKAATGTDNTMAYAKGTAEYKANASLDKDNNGITRGELIPRAMQHYSPGLQMKSDYSDHEENMVVTAPVSQEIQQSKLEGIAQKSECKDGCSVVSETTVPTSVILAPWMNIALREAKQWKGVSERNIADNYHALVGWGATYKDMVGTKRAWCASYVNYCLQETGYTKWKSAPTAKDVAKDPNFIQIDKPIYGAIALYRTSHVCFVFASIPNNSRRFIRLGGNQGDQITCEERSIDGYRFFVPKTYKQHADVQGLAPAQTLADVKKLGLPIGSSTSTR